MEAVKKHLRKFLMNHEGLRVQVRKVHVKMKQNRYRKIAGSSAIDEKLVVFETFMGRQYGCNPKAIYEYMITDPRFDDFSFVWVLNDKTKAELIPQSERVETVTMRSQRYYEVYGKAAHVITNSNLDYGIKPKKGQVFLQTWHGTPLKRLRCDIEASEGNALNSLSEIRQKNNLDVVRYDYFISPSAFASEKFSSAFALKELGKENILIETGYPRNDIMFNADEEYAKKIKEQLGIKDDRKIILYAPTFRDNQHDGAGYTYDTHIDFDRMRDELQEDYIILFRAHYFVASQFDFSRYEGFIYDISSMDDISPFYLISDLLITDYSSVFFDYANLKRPMIFYMYDLEEYANDIRGFYMDLDELPGPIVKTEEELIEAIKQKDLPYDDRYRRFNDKYNYLDDGNASRRVVDIIFS